jgi:hypothetical protein
MRQKMDLDRLIDWFIMLCQLMFDEWGIKAKESLVEYFQKQKIPAKCS